jgi:hypothetical protein
MTMYNARIRLVAVGILAVILKQLDNGKSKSCHQVYEDIKSKKRMSARSAAILFLGFCPNTIDGSYTFTLGCVVLVSYRWLIFAM